MQEQSMPPGDPLDPTSGELGQATTALAALDEDGLSLAEQADRLAAAQSALAALLDAPPGGAATADESSTRQA